MSSYLSRGLQENIDKTPINNGKIRFALDSARLFIDTVSERIEITDIVKGLTRSEIEALESPLPKVYLSSDDHCMLVYDYEQQEWIVYGVASSNTVVDVDFNVKGDIVLQYADGHIETKVNNKIAELEARIKALEEAQG